MILFASIIQRLFTAKSQRQKLIKQINVLNLTLIQLMMIRVEKGDANVSLSSLIVGRKNKRLQ